MQGLRLRRSSVPTLPSESKKNGGWHTARSTFVSSLRLKVTVDQEQGDQAPPVSGFTTMKGRLWEKTKQRREAEKFTSKKLVPLSKKDYQALRSLFEKYDKSEDGVLSKEEFTQGISEMQPVLQPHALGMFSSTDKDQSGWLSFEEFLSMHCPWLHPTQMANCIKKYGKPWDISEEEKDAAEMKRKAKALRDVTVSVKEQGDIEKVYDSWARESGSPVKGGGLSFQTVKQRCEGLDSYTLRDWFHEYGTPGVGGKRLGKSAFVALVSGHYKSKGTAEGEPTQGNENHERRVKEQQELVRSLHGRKLTNSQQVSVAPVQ